MRFVPYLLMATVLTLEACTRVGVPPAEPPGDLPGSGGTSLAAARTLSGVTTLGGQRLKVVLELTAGDPGRGRGHLEIPDLPLTAEGLGGWRGDTLELDLRYEGACPGDLRIRAKRVDDGTRAEGTLTAKDCTGEASGPVVLEAATGPRARRGPPPR